MGFGTVGDVLGVRSVLCHNPNSWCVVGSGGTKIFGVLAIVVNWRGASSNDPIISKEVNTRK
ncbi:unnamed protein product [Lupinus luteus]|uniref:Uncharacterized protein n=1 Tax=Lupinus luteus TaxID=3873 RepID=A0AAV1WGB0_LUPLU